MAIPAKAAFDVFTDVRGMVTFYLFILEESIQTAMMGAYMARKDGMISQSQIIALELKQGLIADAKAFNTLVGPIAYPMNDAFAAFYQASEDMCTFYINSTPPGGVMASGKSWISQALGTLRSQWHFHMDLLDLWKDELGCVSLSLFVMGIPNDLATYQKVLSYYEHLIYLFAFDTGFDPIVAIYDGEIRQTPFLYEFFSKSPIYMNVSGMYYNSKLEDVNTQFTTQFLGNLALFWTVIIPDIFLHTAASAPQVLFESKANKTLTMRYITLANAGDFFKWLSHGYSLALKNYAPFIASPELWRIHNPIIDLYWWTLYSHILCLQAFKQIEESRRIKPFIETQKVVISVNGQEYAEDRLTGDGEISICIPKADLDKGFNRICFNTYNIISCIENITLYSKWRPSFGGLRNLEISPEWTLCDVCDWGLPVHVKADFPYSSSLHQSGFLFYNPGECRLKIKFRVLYTPSPYITAGVYADYYSSPTVARRVISFTPDPTKVHELDIPGVEFFWLRAGIGAKYGALTGVEYNLVIDSVSIIPDGVPIASELLWKVYPSVDPCTLTPWPD